MWALAFFLSLHAAEIPLERSSLAGRVHVVGVDVTVADLDEREYVERVIDREINHRLARSIAAKLSGAFERKFATSVVTDVALPRALVEISLGPTDFTERSKRGSGTRLMLTFVARLRVREIGSTKPSNEVKLLLVAYRGVEQTEFDGVMITGFPSGRAENGAKLLSQLSCSFLFDPAASRARPLPSR